MVSNILEESTFIPLGRKKEYGKRYDQKAIGNPITVHQKRLNKWCWKREILSLYIKKGQVNYNETKLLFQHNVLEAKDDNGEKLYYNDNIMNRYFSTIME